MKQQRSLSGIPQGREEPTIGGKGARQPDDVAIAALEPRRGIGPAQQICGVARIGQHLTQLRRGQVGLVGEHIADDLRGAIGQPVGPGLSFARSAQIDDGAQAQPCQSRAAVRVEPVEIGGAKQQVAPHPSAIAGRPAAKVAQVGQRGDIDLGTGFAGHLIRKSFAAKGGANVVWNLTSGWDSAAPPHIRQFDACGTLGHDRAAARRRRRHRGRLR